MTGAPGDTSTGPVDVADPPAHVLADFHAQSHGKDVSPVETLFFGTDLSNGLARPVPGQERPRLPALGPLRDLDAVGPALGGSWSRAQRLLAACVEAVRVRRVSAADRYPVHRAYPSPRGLFGADLFVVPAADDTASWCLRVDPQSHALQPWRTVPVPVSGDPNGMDGTGGTDHPNGVDGLDDPGTALAGARLVVAVDHHRYPPEYGRLRPSLALLEGGHLLATLGLTLNRAGLRPRTHFGPTDTPMPRGFSPCGAITLETSEATGPPQAVDPAPDTSATVPDTRGTHFSGRTSGVPTAPTVSADAVARVVRVAAEGALPGTSLRRWLDDRTSGVSTANLVTSAHVSPEDGSGVTAPLVTALDAVQEAAPGTGSLRLYRKVLVEDRVDDRATVELTPDGSTPDSATHDGTVPGPHRVARTGETNFSASLGYTLAVDFRPWARAHGDHAQTVLHTLLGWTAQWGCLGAAATGLCARPMRNYQESDWAAVLGLDPHQTPAYQLWIRRERGTYMDSPVDADH